MEKTKKINYQIILIIFVLVFLMTNFILGEIKYLNYIKEHKIILGTTEEEYNENFKINKLIKKNNNFYYNKLNTKEKEIYGKIANIVKNKENAFVVDKKNYPGSFEKTLSNSIEAFIDDHPEVFYISKMYKFIEYNSLLSKKYIVTIDYNYNIIDIDNKINELDYEIKRLIKNLKDKDEYTKEYIVNEYLSQNVDYDYTKNRKNTHNIYGALIERKAVCDGISNAANILLNNLDVDSILVVGKLKKDLHAWNLVKIGDEYYHLDITSNISLKEEEGIYAHNYFNVTTDEIKKTHNIKNEEIYPKAVNLTENYYIKNGYTLSVKENMYDKLNSIIDKSLGNNVIEFKNIDIANVKETVIDILKKRADVRFNSIRYYEMGDIIMIKIK